MSKYWGEVFSLPNIARIKCTEEEKCSKLGNTSLDLNEKRWQNWVFDMDAQNGNTQYIMIAHTLMPPSAFVLFEAAPYCCCKQRTYVWAIKKTQRYSSFPLHKHKADTEFSKRLLKLSNTSTPLLTWNWHKTKKKKGVRAAQRPLENKHWKKPLWNTSQNQKHKRKGRWPGRWRTRQRIITSSNRAKRHSFGERSSVGSYAPKSYSSVIYQTQQAWC